MFPNSEKVQFVFINGLKIKKNRKKSIQYYANLHFENI